jgi:hypothetical protein
MGVFKKSISARLYSGVVHKLVFSWMERVAVNKFSLCMSEKGCGQSGQFQNSCPGLDRLE